MFVLVGLLCCAIGSVFGRWVLVMKLKCAIERDFFVFLFFLGSSGVRGVELGSAFGGG